MPHAFQTRPDHPAIHTLVRLHADLGAKIQANKEQGLKLAEDMKHVEAVIRMFDPAYDVRAIAVRRRNRENPWFKRGEIIRAALDVLRATEGPMTTKDICRRLLADKGVAEPTGAQIRNLVGAVHRSLQGHKGRTVEAVGEGMPVRWRLA